MNIEESELSGVLVITPGRFGDHRGFFSETYSRRLYADHGIDIEFVQDNHSLSTEVGTVRGLHFQAPPFAQDKIVRCGRGVIFDVAVDIRSGSPTYGQWAGYELSAKNGKQVFLPAGFAHGFMTLQGDSEIVYKCSEYYAPESEVSLRWDDPTIGINWPSAGKAILSGKDLKAPALADLETPFTWESPS